MIFYDTTIKFRELKIPARFFFEQGFFYLDNAAEFSLRLSS